MLFGTARKVQVISSPLDSFILTTRLSGQNPVSLSAHAACVKSFLLTMTTFPTMSGVILALGVAVSAFAATPPAPLLNEPVDVSGDFRDLSNYYYLANE